MCGTKLKKCCKQLLSVSDSPSDPILKRRSILKRNAFRNVVAGSSKLHSLLMLEKRFLKQFLLYFNLYQPGMTVQEMRDMKIALEDSLNVRRFFPWQGETAECCWCACHSKTK
ncbi:uncharacterized protein LOC121596216 [Anopheles merus]|uniref:uncharacterized protein LOC121596216 n=1 Tax=Anopheles merus TaxID=30066 RepID=UPI001BE451BF|nr:uncharacterized protein LOC121596216 [Anopheles merus]